MVVARDVADLLATLSCLTTRGGAHRVITLLRLSELKSPSPLPLRATG
jgi:Lrp/AsnC family transcriptional regulator, leucine-responsive regulatory protein